MDPDENFRKSSEENIGITGSARDGFRSDVTTYMFTLLRAKKKIDLKAYSPLKEAIENKLMASVKDMSRIVTKSKSRDNKQQKKYGGMVATLIEEYGYNEDSAEEVIKLAAKNSWGAGSKGSYKTSVIEREDIFYN